MIPLRALMTAKTVVGPQLIARYNNLRAVNINGAAAPGHSSGEALAAMERASQKLLPPGYTFEWTSTVLQQQQAAGQTFYILGIAVAFAYLFLVALYERFAMPLAVLFSIAIALMGATVALLFAVPPLHIVFERLRSLDALCPDMCSGDPPEWHFRLSLSGRLWPPVMNLLTR